MSKLFVAAFIFLLLILQPSIALAAKPSAQAQAAAQKKKLEAVQAQIKKLSEDQKKLEQQRAEANASVREMDAKVARASKLARQSNQQLMAQQSQLELLEKDKQALELKLVKQKQALAALIRSAYALGKTPTLELVLSQDKISDSSRALAYHHYFQIDQKAQLDTISRQLQELSLMAEKVKQQQQQYVQAKQLQEKNLADLNEQRKQRDLALAQVDAQYRDKKTRLNALGRDEKNLNNLLDKLQRLMAQKPVQATPRNSRKTPGKPLPMVPMSPMRLPVQGSVLAGFGGSMPDGHRSDGLLIAGNIGAEVRAVAAGRVAYADWLKGYGLLLIVDHGNGWMSLYAFNDSLLKNVGDSVKTDDAIATLGRSGGQSSPALYFELRQNGQPKDPRVWLKP
ncbi:MAG TPA: peptidoglycan DD-metalloendopeptidase family protein [Arenimonas sp.]|nr:peptidoglycan DD-metalloendopeptidase family protein [Arenimonas sp.]HPO24206.1 peptidoglycan DD-metalloendopeptidase family protein [Arenimonas sp.]HPW32021.1 peptidoglycan DD-metalloendopeptidase family protein [Arenimonas sp.]